MLPIKQYENYAPVFVETMWTETIPAGVDSLKETDQEELDGEIEGG